MEKKKRTVEKIYHENYFYNQNNSVSTKRYMICDKYQLKKCPARLKYEVDENNIKNFVVTNNHNHVKPKIEYLIRQFREEFKKAIITDSTKPCIIYAKLCLRFPEGAALVPFSSMLSTINNWRREIRPSQPKTLKDYVDSINMERWKNLLTLNNTKLRAIHINSSDRSSAAILADKNFLNSINPSHLLVDATYEVCPRSPAEIYQFLTIMAVIGDCALPIMWAIMTNKTKLSYTDIFTYFATTLAPHLQINCVTSDFELGLMGAIKSVYADARIQGCYFHFNQAILKKTTEFKLRELIEEREDIKIFVRKLLCLALLPANDITQAFMWLVNSHKDISQLLIKLIHYFESYWLKIVKPVRFSNYRNHNKTNNFIESYHRVLKLKIGSHPPIWEFTEQLAALQELTKIEKASLEQNLQIRSRTKHEIVSKKAMYEYLWDLYDNGSLDIANFLECTRHMSKAFNNNHVWASIDDINNFIMPIV